MSAKYLVFASIIFVGCQSVTVSTPVGVECQSLSFDSLESEHINPVSLLENGEYLTKDGATLSKACTIANICQINDYVRQRFSQSYYVPLNSVGGREIKRQFPNIVRMVEVGPASSKQIYLNDFCRRARDAVVDE